MTSIPRAAQDHYAAMQQLQVLAIAAARRSWRRVDPRFISESWSEALRSLTPVVAAVQVRAATSGSSYGAASLAEQGLWVAPEVFVDPQAFGGYAADGRSLSGLLYSPAVTVKASLKGHYFQDDAGRSIWSPGLPMAEALRRGQGALDMLVRTTVADAGRQAAGVDTAARPGVGYTRMLNPPSCGRCAILAGRFYRWNAGFKRHPGCDCVHVQSTQGAVAGATSEGLLTDPKAYFDGLPEADQNRLFGAANARAIRDGGDMNRVVNAGPRKAGGPRGSLTTTEGTARRGFAANVRGQRLTPEGIYRQAGSRDEALKLLEKHGYTYPGGKTPGGAPGYGQMGRGGTRIGARSAVDQANATGIRTGSRATMTAAERRVFDSEQRYLAVLDGRNPYSRNGSGLTPTISAQVETDYRRWLASNGEVFTRS